MTLRPGVPEEVGMCSRRLERVRAAMRGWMAQIGQRAVVALVARHGVVVLHEALGQVRPDEDSPATQPDTIFWTASITKLLTATAAMILVEEGKLGLNLPVSLYLPEIAGEGRDAITVLHLLTHTSGLREEDVDKYAKKVAGNEILPPPEPSQHPEFAKYLALRWSAPLWKPPGQEMSYCNHGFCLLGEVVRRVSGRSLADFARKRIFEPLEVTDTSYALPDARAHRTALPPDPYVAAWMERFRRVPLPSGAVFSTGPDLGAFGQMFLDMGGHGAERILSPTTVAAMTRNQIPGIGARSSEGVFPEACWGLGWGVLEGRKGVPWGLTLASPSTFSHDGFAGNFLCADPATGLLLVYLSTWHAPGDNARFAHTQVFGPRMFSDSICASIVDGKEAP